MAVLLFISLWATINTSIIGHHSVSVMTCVSGQCWSSEHPIENTSQTQLNRQKQFLACFGSPPDRGFKLVWTREVHVRLHRKTLYLDICADLSHNGRHIVSALRWCWNVYFGWNLDTTNNTLKKRTSVTVSDDWSQFITIVYKWMLTEWIDLLTISNFNWIIWVTSLAYRQRCIQTVAWLSREKHLSVGLGGTCSSPLLIISVNTHSFECSFTTSHAPGFRFSALMRLGTGSGSENTSLCRYRSLGSAASGGLLHHC